MIRLMGAHGSLTEEGILRGLPWMRLAHRHKFVIACRVLATLVVIIAATKATPSYSEHALADTGNNPVVTENQQPGSNKWQLGLPGFRVADDVAKQIKGFASATSVNKGATITFRVTVNPVQSYTIDIYRLGWYQGNGGRLLQHIGPLEGVTQPACPVDPTTGLIECKWSASHILTVPNTWTSGIYLALLTNAQGYQNYISFVVRDDARRADMLYQQPVDTYQAYNNYPDDGATGKSLYPQSSYGANTVTGTTSAVKVSFDRPYPGNGASAIDQWYLKDQFVGQLLDYEINFVRWLERSGYDVAYSTNIDTHANGNRLLNYLAFLSVGHDEYWSKPMYDAVQHARDRGVDLAFFGANSVFRQIRFESSSDGVANRVMVNYKSASLDPVQGETTTVSWRHPLPNRPEQRLLGIQYHASLVRQNAPYVVVKSSHWIYQGTGFRDGDSVPGLVGYEFDRYMSRYPSPVTRSWTILSQSPLVNVAGGTDYANSSLYQAPSGAWVFAAGTISWGWGLDNYRAHNVVDSRIQRTTANLLDRFADDIRPLVKAPAQTFAVPSPLGTTAIPVRLKWSATDTTSGVVRYQLQQSTNYGTYAGVSLPTATTTSISRWLTSGSTYRFRVRALDGAENWSGWAYGPRFVVDARQETSTDIAYSSTGQGMHSADRTGGTSRTRKPLEPRLLCPVQVTVSRGYLPPPPTAASRNCGWTE